jgi:hypothetical protein
VITAVLGQKDRSGGQSSMMMMMMMVLIHICFVSVD